ncbi:MAG: adenosylcobinamide-GDP ribazoletransferase [Chloroflexi bacterium]|nr:adenosylcobinamide-GDP ribazoletransferase [Chloroflexota bacterium]
MLSRGFPPPVTAALLLGAWVLFTGGLHLDGLMDVCDGVFSQPDPARRLAVMRDTRAGSYGVLGAVCLLVLKFAVLLSLAPGMQLLRLSPALVGLLMAPTLGRWAMVLATAAFPSARPEGLGQLVKSWVGWPQVAAATAIALAASMALGPMGVALLPLAAVVAWLGGAYFQANLGGLTGDTYGAINEVTEVLVLLAAAAAVPEVWWHGW